MTDRLKSRLELAAIVLGVGIAWGVLTAQVADKLDRSDFEVDSVAIHGEIRAVLERVDRTNAALDETNARLREIVCLERPAGCR